MADYKELLRRAVEALPENNGAARRAVYEKARAALVGQLRAINPPLAARDITTHRLQLEDCIRQVEQEASEAVIAGMGATQEALPPPVHFEPTNKAQPPAARATAQPRQAGTPKALPAGGTIEDIIAAANMEPAPEAEAEAPAPRANPPPAAEPIPMRRPALSLAEVEPEAEAEAEDEADEAQEILPPRPAAGPAARPLPSIVARAEAAKGRSASTAFGLPREKPYDAPRRGPTLEPRREGARLEPAARGGQQAAAARQLAEPVAMRQEPSIAAAMSAVREVEVEPQPVDPQSDIDRAIATLDREARGDTQPVVDEPTVELDDEDEPAFARGRKVDLGSMFAGTKGRSEPEAEPVRGERPVKPAKPERPARPPRNRRDAREMALPEAGFPRARPEDERGGMSAVTIFLVVLAVLLVGAGGASYWAVSQGYVDLGSMFRSSQTAEAEVPLAAPAPTAVAEATAPATGPGNTATPVAAAPASELQAEERLVPEPSLTGAEPLALAPIDDGAKTEERLSDTGTEGAADAEAAVAAIDPANAAGSQSLLLEDSDQANGGAVPFSGTVEWSRGTDETGQPTLLAKAKIPARNLGVDILIRKNMDPALPASHLMEINFSLSDGFIGGSIAGLPGVLLKNQELVQGTPLVGPAGVRVVANSFLFALSASPEDAATNSELLTSRKWMDLFVIYATGKRAILTLEKDDAAQTLFAEVFETWNATASAQ